MRKLHFEVERSTLPASRDAAYLVEDEANTEALRLAVWDNIRLDVLVTVGGVTAPAAFWEDPGHWAEDWEEVLGVEFEDEAAARAAVEEILVAAIND